LLFYFVVNDVPGTKGQRRRGTKSFDTIRTILGRHKGTEAQRHKVFIPAYFILLISEDSILSNSFAFSNNPSNSSLVI